MNTPNYYFEFFFVFLGESVTIAMFYDDSVDFYVSFILDVWSATDSLKYKNDTKFVQLLLNFPIIVFFVNFFETPFLFTVKYA